jgi:hypothetical protein
MNTKLYYLNNNETKHYLLQDFENQVIYSDDLIWFEGLSHWIKADQVEELKVFLKKRPPSSNNKIIIKKSIIISITVYFVLSTLIALIAGFGEKNKFESFISQIKKAHNENENEIAKNKINLTNQYKLKFVKNQKQKKIEKLEELLSNIDKDIKANLEEWKNAQNSNYSDEVQLFNYKIKHEKLLLEFDRYTNLIEENYSSSESLGNNEIKLVDYEIPMNEIYIFKPNESKYYTRWCVYVSDYTKNENLSFESCHKFWFRPYFALFADSNLSDAEQKSDFTLFVNFLTSSLASNIIILIITFLVVFYSKKKDLKAKKK